MNKDRISYCIDGSGRAVELRTCKVLSEKALINRFNNACASDQVVKAFCQVDKDSEEQVKEGMTSYGVETKDSKLLTIAIHENNYKFCKDQMAILNSSVNKANEKISVRRKEKGRKILIGGFAVAVFGTVAWAGKIQLEKAGIIGKKDTVVQMTTEAPTEMTTEDFSTPVDATTEETSFLNNMDADELRQRIEQNNKVETEKELSELAQNRIELGLNSEVVPVANNDNTDQIHYGYSEIINDAEKTRSVIDQSNQDEIERQQQELEALRESYKNEYQKVR